MNCNCNIIINKRLMMDKTFEIEFTKGENGNVNNDITCSKVIMYLKDNKFIIIYNESFAKWER